MTKFYQLLYLNLFIFIFFSFYSSLFAVHTILLKQGKTIKGTVSNQNLDNLEIQSQDGQKIIIPKKSVLKIIYKDLAEEEESNIRKSEEQKREAERAKLREQKKQALLAQVEADKKSTVSATEFNTNSNAKSSIRDSFVLASPNKTELLVLAGLDQKCKVHSEYPEYFWMFGAFRFFEPKLSELLPKKNVPIRISQRSSYKDIAFTMLGGFLITLTRKTLVVEACEGEVYKVISEKEIDQIKNSMMSEISTENEIDNLQEKNEIELLEQDLKELDKMKSKK